MHDFQDGKVSKIELFQATAFKKPDVEEFFGYSDTNKDNYIDIKELSKYFIS